MRLHQSQRSGNPFIDDNHQDLLLLIADLAKAVRRRLLGEGGNWQDIQVSANNYIQALERHFDHEELILNGANYGKTVEHSAKHRGISHRLRALASEDFTKETALYFVASARTKVFSHELIEDQDYWMLFEEEDTSHRPLIDWSKTIETGDQEVDAHHQALIKFINRLHLRVSSVPDRNLLSEELEGLYAYSDLHFSEEEKVFETLISAKDRSLHESDHQHLLGSLRTVINQTKSGDYNIDSIGSYLKYWFLNHLMTFDRTAFRSSPGEADL